MPWGAPGFGGAVLWVNDPSTPLDAEELNLSENEEAAYAAQVGQSVVDYFEGGHSSQIVNNPAGAAEQDLLVRSGGGWTRLPVGASGDELQVDASGHVGWSVPRSVPVLGAFDGQEASDATIAGGTLDQVTSSIVGSWAVGKTVVITDQTGATGIGFASTISSVSGTTATMAMPAPGAVANARIIIGTDDTTAWLNAIAQLPTSGSGRSLAAKDGFSLVSAYLRLPVNGNLRAEGKGATVLVCAAAAAGLGIGPAFTSGPDSHGRCGGFTVDGALLATQPFLVNAKDAIIEDVSVAWANGDNAMFGGQNTELIFFESAGAKKSNVVLDNGVGDYNFEKVYLSFCGESHVRSQALFGGHGYGWPQYVYFNEGSFEDRNVWLPGSPSLACVHLHAGKYITFKDIKFYMGGYGTGSKNALVWMDRPSDPASPYYNADVGLQINGEHEFRDCSLFGPGAGAGSSTQYGFLLDANDGAGNAQLLSQQIQYAFHVRGEVIVTQGSIDYVVGQQSLSKYRLHDQRPVRYL